MTQQYPLHKNCGDSLREAKEHMTKQQKAVWTAFFIPAKGQVFKSRIWWTDEEWRERNGIYIVGCNSVNDSLFACMYSEQAWKILAERCKGGTHKNFDKYTKNVYCIDGKRR